MDCKLQKMQNQNQSHVKCSSLEPSADHTCIPTSCSDSGIKNLPGCGPPELQCNSCYDVPTGHQRQCECNDCINARKAVSGQDCPQHTEGNKWQDLGRKFRDPVAQEIHERMTSSDGMKSMFRWCPDDEWLRCIDRRFRQAQRGYLGQAWIHYGAAQDCDFPKKMIHGVVREPTSGYDLIRPPLKTWVQQLDEDLNESIYESNRLYPTGKSHDQMPNLPLTIHPDTTTFGNPNKTGIKAGDLINPPCKDRHVIENESNCCRHLYRMTHGSYDPGEQICRNYSGTFNRSDTFGTPTPNDVAGRWCKKVIGTWRSCKPDPPYVSKVYADHLDQRVPKLGMAQDRLCIRKEHGDDRTYGKSSAMERERPIREIIFNRCPNEGAEKSIKIMQLLKEWLWKVRQSFKSGSGADFETFYEELVANDPECNGTIEWEPFMQALKRHRVPRTMCVEEDFMSALAYVNVFHPAPCNVLNYYLLMDLIKGFENPRFKANTTTLKPWYVPHTNSCIHFRTTYSDQTANMCVKQSCITWDKEQRVHGMPSVRTDRLPNKIRSAKDFTNYGDDGDAYSLIFPSVYTTRGVTCRDVFRDISRDDMLKILCKANVKISFKEFDCVWELAKTKDPDNQCRVCFQTFREALCEHRSGPDSCVEFAPDVKITDCCHEQEQPGCVSCANRRKDKPNPCAGVDP